MQQDWSHFDSWTQTEAPNSEHTETVHGPGGGGHLWLWMSGREPTGCPWTWTSQILTVTSLSLLEGPPDQHPPTLSWTSIFCSSVYYGRKEKEGKSRKPSDISINVQDITLSSDLGSRRLSFLHPIAGQIVLQGGTLSGFISTFSPVVSSKQTCHLSSSQTSWCYQAIRYRFLIFVF